MVTNERLNRAAIIGCRNFSPAHLYSLLSVIDELALPDEDSGPMVDEVRGWQESFPSGRASRVFRCDFKEAAESGIVVIAAATQRGPSETDLEVLRKNADLVREIAFRLKENAFAGVILVTTNPVDIMAQAALEGSGLAPGQVIGEGRILDTERFQRILDAKSEDKFAAAEPVEAATWCAAQTGSRPVVDFCEPNCPEFGTMLQLIGHTPPEIIRGKRNPPAAGGSCVKRICQAVLEDERVVLPVCAMTSGQIGTSGVFLNLPCVIGRNGVEGIIEPRLSDAEAREIKESARVLELAFRALESKVLTVNTN